MVTTTTTTGRLVPIWSARRRAGIAQLGAQLDGLDLEGVELRTEVDAGEGRPLAWFWTVKIRSERAPRVYRHDNIKGATVQRITP